MMLSPVEAVASVVATQASLPVSTPIDTSAPGSFANILQQQLGELQTNLGAAEMAMSNLAAGKPVELHEVMITMERARISVQTFVQVRNKLVESWQDLMRMQL